jgi:alkylation response protein AidB-like acyl-CoA dehydrogenase
MNSTDYSADRRDIRFVQKELLQIQQLQELEAFSDFSEDDFDMVVTEGTHFAETVFAPLNKNGDEQATRMEDGRAVAPEGFKEAWRKYAEGGWMGITSGQEVGGQALPVSVAIAVMECLYGSNPSLYTITMLTAGSAGLIETFGTDEQKAIFAEKMIAGDWSGTMCLSESNAGSAVGDITTRAVKAADGDHYLIQGTKQWISGGDHDLTENIVHLVLARTEGAPPGPRGISLFIVPKYRADAAGNLGEFNHVDTVRLEHKLGIKASPTAVLEFGAGGESHGYLLEEECRGMAQMFKLMNEARLTVAYQGLGSASGAFRNALAYARDRVQGIAIEKGKDQGAERVPITRHPDVRNMLMTMKALVEGMRALIYAVAYYTDMAHHGPEETRTYFQDLVDILTPVAKNTGADQGFEAVRLGVQVLGGVGFTEEFPLAQALRDTKIASIYEGTTGIQALDLVTRKLALRNGELFQTLLQAMSDLEPDMARQEPVRLAIEQWQDAVEKLKLTVASLKNLAEELGPREAVLNATDVAVFFGDVACAYYLLKSALVAEGRLAELSGGNGDFRAAAEEDEEARFYFNKIKTAEHYVFQILPRTQAVVAKVQSRNFAALEAVL